MGHEELYYSFDLCKGEVLQNKVLEYFQYKEKINSMSTMEL